ncbi:MAG: DNA-3-methyladenine glycosylase I [Ilumatobacteraceae bacterium]
MSGRHSPADRYGAVVLRPGPDGILRCAWCGDDPLYVSYHDLEWGRPVTDDVGIYERLCLEGFQAGLSWLTILRKRPAFRVAFAGFDPHVVAEFGEADVLRLLGDPSIVRHRGKIESTVNNARRALEMIEQEGSIAAFVERYRPHRHVRPRPGEPVSSTSVESEHLARELRRRGWTFVGPTTVYAFMQATGIVDDHVVGCAVDELRSQLA